MKKSFLMVMFLLLFACSIFIAVPSASASLIYPDQGTYTGFQYVCVHMGLQLSGYYTTDKSDPRTSITRQEAGYHQHFRIDSPMTIKAVRWYRGDEPDYNIIYENVYSAKYKIKPFPAPRLKTAANKLLSYPKSVTIINIPPDCKAYYTVDGSDPTTNIDAILYDGNPISVGSSMTVKAAFAKTCYCIRDEGHFSPLETGWGPVTTATL
jgi:hypothetical protein